MWTLKKDDETHYIWPGKEVYEVGRASGDFVFENDASISRSHCKILYKNNIVRMADNSKYGTYINAGIDKNIKLQPGEEVVLNDGDKVRFGVLRNTWVFEEKRIIMVHSALKPNEIAKLEQVMKKIGGRIANEINNDCTHITMSTMTLTLKFVYGLAFELPIVRPEYWYEVLKCLETKKIIFPKVEDFKPTPTTFCNDVSKKLERRKLFVGFTFLFLTKKHLDMYGVIVKKLGATCRDLYGGVQKDFLLKPKVIVIEYLSSDDSPNHKAITFVKEVLGKSRRRLIPEYEIGMAIAACSTAEYCNPLQNGISRLFPKSQPPPRCPARSDPLFIENTPITILYPPRKPGIEGNAFIEETETTTQQQLKLKQQQQKEQIIDKNIIRNDEKKIVLKGTEQNQKNFNERKRIFINDDEDDDKPSTSSASLASFGNSDKKPPFVKRLKSVDLDSQQTIKLNDRKRLRNDEPSTSSTIHGDSSDSADSVKAPNKKKIKAGQINSSQLSNTIRTYSRKPIASICKTNRKTSIESIVIESSDDENNIDIKKDVNIDINSDSNLDDEEIKETDEEDVASDEEKLDHIEEINETDEEQVEEITESDEEDVGSDEEGLVSEAEKLEQNKVKLDNVKEKANKVEEKVATIPAPKATKQEDNAKIENVQDEEDDSESETETDSDSESESEDDFVLDPNEKDEDKIVEALLNRKKRLVIGADTLIDPKYASKIVEKFFKAISVPKKRKRSKPDKDFPGASTDEDDDLFNFSFSKKPNLNKSNPSPNTSSHSQGSASQSDALNVSIRAQYFNYYTDKSFPYGRHKKDPKSRSMSPLEGFEEPPVSVLPLKIVNSYDTLTQRYVKKFVAEARKNVGKPGVKPSADDEEARPPSPKKKTKKVYIDVLADDGKEDEKDNDDDGDLFKFVGEKNKPLVLKRVSPAPPSSDEEHDPEEFRCLERLKHILPKPKLLPEKVDIKDWMACCGLKTQIKPEFNFHIAPRVFTDVAEAAREFMVGTIQDAAQSMDDSYNSVKAKEFINTNPPEPRYPYHGGFQIHFISVDKNEKNRNRNQTQSETENQDEEADRSAEAGPSNATGNNSTFNNTKKNFKNFKKTKVVTQKLIVRTLDPNQN